jgi:hypothetical protein
MSDQQKLTNVIRTWMTKNVQDNAGAFGIYWQVNCTQLAVDCANALTSDPDQWLDDEEHIVWDIAIDVGEQYEAKNRPD